MKNNTLGLIAILAICGAAHAQRESKTFPDARPVHSRSENHPHVGLIVGLASAEDQEAYKGEFGVNVGFQPYIPFGLGAEISRTRTENEANETSDKTNVLAKATYNFGGNEVLIRNSYAGIDAGVIVRDDTAHFAAGPEAGFDIPIAESMISLGGNTKYLFAEGSESDVFSVNGVLKYWF